MLMDSSMVTSLEDLLEDLLELFSRFSLGSGGGGEEAIPGGVAERRDRCDRDDRFDRCEGVR